MRLGYEKTVKCEEMLLYIPLNVQEKFLFTLQSKINTENEHCEASRKRELKRLSRKQWRDMIIMSTSLFDEHLQSSVRGKFF